MCCSGDLRSERQRWIEAGKRLASDPEAKVSCPSCADAYLVTTDVNWDDGIHLDRHMQCPKCGARNVLTKFLKDKTG